MKFSRILHTLEFKNWMFTAQSTWIECQELVAVAPYILSSLQCLCFEPCLCFWTQFLNELLALNWCHKIFCPGTIFVGRIFYDNYFPVLYSFFPYFSFSLLIFFLDSPFPYFFPFTFLFTFSCPFQFFLCSSPSTAWLFKIPFKALFFGYLWRANELTKCSTRSFLIEL